MDKVALLVLYLNFEETFKRQLILLNNHILIVFRSLSLRLFSMFCLWCFYSEETILSLSFSRSLSLRLSSMFCLWCFYFREIIRSLSFSRCLSLRFSSMFCSWCFYSNEAILSLIFSSAHWIRMRVSAMICDNDCWRFIGDPRHLHGGWLSANDLLWIRRQWQLVRPLWKRRRCQQGIPIRQRNKENLPRQTDYG